MPEESGFWSSTDFPYTCLRDRARTTALAEVVTATVRPGDRVLDAGAGTGILSLYAARAGAREVHAVETDSVLCRYLRETVRRNGLEDVVTVLEEDVHTVHLPAVDVAVVEMVETALVDEAEVSAHNALLANGTAGPGTRWVPSGYTTWAEPVVTDDRHDGFQLVLLRHDWSYYARNPDVWGTWPVEPVAAPVPIWSATFGQAALEPVVRARIEVPDDPRVNGLRLTGKLAVPDGRALGDFPSLNGPKVVPLPSRPPGTRALEVDYTMSAGFGSFTATWTG